MDKIQRQVFGKSGHMSTRVIFGSASIMKASQKEADQVMDMIMESGINHIDTAAGYGDAEVRLGPWMKHHRTSFFLATKTDKVTYKDAKEQFYRSLERLQVDRVDLLQLHNLTDVANRENIMFPGGAIEFLAEAKEKGLAQLIGITGHGSQTPKMHLQSLRRYNFDSVLLPCNYLLMQNPEYADAFQNLLSYCQEHDIAMQTIKSIARGLWGNKQRTLDIWYEPLTDEEAVAKAVHWVLGRSGIFLITVAEMWVLPKVLAAAASWQSPPSDEEMKLLVKRYQMEPIF